MLQRPSCLHVPALYEEGFAKISWESASDAVSYQLECVFNETFEQASTGRSWTALDAAQKTWVQLEGDGLSWLQFEALSAQGLAWQNIEYSNSTWAILDAKKHTWCEIETLPASFLIFDGIGTPAPAPDQGSTWGQLESKGINWAEMEAQGLKWQEIELIACTGLTWSQSDSKSLTWTQIEKQDKTWRMFSEYPSYGLCWESIDARYLPWGERDTKALTWEALEHITPDNNTHMTFVAAVPLYQKLVSYRIRAFDGKDYSEYLTSTLLKVNPRSIAKYRPPCVHIPELHETESAKIVWGELYGASDYVVERASTQNFAVRYTGPGAPASTPADCDVWEKLWYTPDCKRHMSFTDTLSAGERQVVYRIKGRNTTDESQYLTTAVIPVIPVFYREDSINLAVTAGLSYVVQLHARSIEALKAIAMRLIYSAELLTVERFASEQPNAKTDMGGMPYVGNVRELSRKSGEICFQCTRAMQSKKQWDGLVVCVRFQALRTGTAKIELR